LSEVEGLGSHLPDSCLTASGVTNNEARVTHFKNFSKVHTLGNEQILGLKTCLFGVVLHIFEEIDISLGFDLNTWEEIVN